MKRRSKEDLLSESLVKAVKRGSILAEVMLGKIYFSNVGSRKVRKDKVYQASADRLVRVCPICKLAWEGIKLSSMSKNKNILYYKNMPKYGKKIQNCIRCSEEEE